MDLKLYLRVIWRFRVVVAAGFVLAVVLAVASVARVDFAHGSPSLSYRQQPTWQSATRLFVTQAGFPWGRSVLPPASPTPVPSTGDSNGSGLEFADPTRFAGLAALYAQLINGDMIQRRFAETLPTGDLLTAQAVTDSTTNQLLPLVDVICVAHTPAEAAKISRMGAGLFQSYIARQQASAKIPSNQRVLLQVVSTRVTLVAGRKKTLPIVAFMAVMAATVGLAFVLENLRPRIRSVAPAEAPPARRVDMRHTA